MSGETLRSLKVLFLTRYPVEGASSRYRVYQYVPHLEALGVRGPAMMFETVHPNARQVSDCSMSGARPSGNRSAARTSICDSSPRRATLSRAQASARWGWSGWRWGWGRCCR